MTALLISSRPQAQVSTSILFSFRVQSNSAQLTLPHTLCHLLLLYLFEYIMRSFIIVFHQHHFGTRRKIKDQSHLSITIEKLLYGDSMLGLTFDPLDGRDFT